MKIIITRSFKCLPSRKSKYDSSLFFQRALAAERRILNQSGSVTARCFLCATDISGKVPFEYLGNRFCTIECLKAHRMKNPLVLS